MASRAYTADDILSCTLLWNNGGGRGYVDWLTILDPGADPATAQARTNRLRLLNLTSGPTGAESNNASLTRLSGLGVRQARKSITGV